MKYRTVTSEVNKKADRYVESELKNDEGFGFMSFAGNLPTLPNVEYPAESRASFACLKMRERNENTEKRFFAEAKHESLWERNGIACLG